MKWVVYILRCGDGTFYTGISCDLDRRLKSHTAGRGARYTKGRGPFEVVYSEPCDDKSHALRRELAIKALDRQAKQTLIAKFSYL